MCVKFLIKHKMRSSFSACQKIQTVFANLLKLAQFSDRRDKPIRWRNEIVIVFFRWLSLTFPCSYIILLTNFVDHEVSISKRNWPRIENTNHLYTFGNEHEMEKQICRWLNLIHNLDLVLVYSLIIEMGVLAVIKTSTSMWINDINVSYESISQVTIEFKH